jgi:hypothetical protein
LTPVLDVFHCVIAALLIKKAGFTRGEAKAGAVTVIQRFGSAAGNLNIHFHSLVIDGVYRLQNGEPAFDYVAPPTPEELARLLERIAKRVMGVLTRCDDVTEESGVPVLEAVVSLQAAANVQSSVACNDRGPGFAAAASD